ncbi:MAG: hypothetical protein WDA53_01245 [Bacillota bacterium]
MNNEEKILSLLEQLSTKVDFIESSMNGGFGASNKRFESLEKNMGSFEKSLGSFEKNMSSLEKNMREGFEASNKRFESLEKNMGSFEKSLGSFEKNMHEGFEASNKRFESLEKNMGSFEKNMREGFEASNKRFESLEDGQKTTFKLIDTLAIEVHQLGTNMEEVKQKLDQKADKSDIVRLENTLLPKIDILFEGQQLNAEKLTRIEQEVSKHEEVILRRYK